MATLLDIGLFQSSGALFPFLFILVLTYAILAMTKLFGDNKAIYALIAFALAIMTIVSPIAVKTINKMAPWFVLLFIFSIFVILAFMTFGVEQSTIKKIITGDGHSSTFFYWVIALALIIGVGSLASVFSEERGFQALSEADGGNATAEPVQDEGTGFFATLFHPKVLGMALLLLIAMFTVRNLAGD